MAGIVPWKEVAALPFEAAVVPQRYYNWLQLPVVSYAIPALVAIGQAKFHFDPPWDPVRRTIRRLCIKPGLRVLENIQPASGGYLEAIPLTSFVSMALIRCGRSEHSVVQKGVQFLLDSYRPSSDDEPNEQGTWPIDTNLATWVTSLSINALANQPNSFRALLENDSSTWQSCVDWLLSCQNRDKHPFTGSEPGGWGWTDLSGAVPDADDTPGAMLALRAIVDANPTWLIDKRRVTLEAAAIAGAEWLLDLQNRDGGWPTFCRGWGKLPFDRSGSDITAHAIRGLLAWRQVCAMQQRERIDRAIAKGFRYLKKQQRADGSWLPLWFGNQDQPDDENPFYGTAKVLMAYRAARLENTQPAIAGASWLLKNQNKDGGWGGCQNGTSSVEETALCTEALFAVDDGAGSQARVGALAGAAWLQAAVASDDVRVSSPIGFYFAKLWYFEKLYPTIFAAGALNRAVFVESGCSADDV